MTPVSHAAVGLAAGGMLIPFAKRLFKIPARALVVIFLISALFPDIDGLSIAISHKAYFGKEWYSHHMFAHSFLGNIVSATFITILYLFFATLSRGIRNLFRKEKKLLEYKLRRLLGAWLAAFIGCTVHLLCDLPTPPGIWKGIALMWPSTTMYGGWNTIFWHNWYLIYISVYFLFLYLLFQVAGGISTISLAFFNEKLSKISDYVFSAIGIIICIVFLVNVHSFLTTYKYNKIGYNKWEKLNLKLIPSEYAKKAPGLYHTFTVFWRESVFTQKKISQTYQDFKNWLMLEHSWLKPKLAFFFPEGRNSRDDMQLYRYLQSLRPGMEDSKSGDYRVWALRDKFPDLDFYNRGFLKATVYAKNKLYLQVSNAWLIIFRIDARDSNGNALKVTKIIHSNKLYVPDRDFPQINQAELQPRYWTFWKHDGIPYNLIPGSGYSVYGNLIQGYYLSINTKPGYIWPGRQTGILLHPGPYSGGCIVDCFLHFDISSLLQYQMYPLWKTAEEIIYTKKLGTVFRGKRRFWGKFMLVKDYDEKVAKHKKLKMAGI